jgi:hypothetical protein
MLSSREGLNSGDFKSSDADSSNAALKMLEFKGGKL